MENPSNTRISATRQIPKTPVFGWDNFKADQQVALPPCVEDLNEQVITTSGRAAIFQALLQLELPENSKLLVPTYHCPTMVAPGLLAGWDIAYFGIGEDGLPNLHEIPEDVSAGAKAMIVSHYFGLPQSLHEVRTWCDARGIALIEDCAHCFFGQAGERQIGAWGDFYTASLSKFFPVPEAGLLGSATRRIKPLELVNQSFKAQLKGWIDVFETSVKYKRLGILNGVFSAIFQLKSTARDITPAQQEILADPATEILNSCDMGRIHKQPLALARLLHRLLPRERIIRQRVRNFDIYAKALANTAGAKPVINSAIKPVAPYVYPLWVNDGNRVYHELRTKGYPVFRWDRIWPGTPQITGDVGLDWSMHVLQLLCHQDLSETDIQATAAAVQASISNISQSTASGLASDQASAVEIHA
jgi:perosamine synthetase